MPMIDVPHPDLVLAQTDPEGAFAPPSSCGVDVVFGRDSQGRLSVDVGATTQVSRVLLRWSKRAATATRVLGDAWERAYGDLEWRVLRAERPLPWAALTHDPQSGMNAGFGVMVRGGAFAFWLIDQDGVTLVLDLRSGAAAVQPGPRHIRAAAVCWTEDPGPAYHAHRSLFRHLCDDPLAVDGPLVGANNWYYAYGKDFDLDSVVADARTVAELSDGHPTLPFGVIDDGWSAHGTADGLPASAGPWTHGHPSRFPEMAEAAAAIRSEHVRPGIWFRPLLTRDIDQAGKLTDRDGAIALDPSSPPVLDLVSDDIARLAGWGFELIKHDFSTYDITGAWGYSFGAEPPVSAPLADRTVTTAEALVTLYERIHHASGEAVLIGCNTVGHLAAGLVHAHRAGDDTSGRDWDRTRKMAVNTLAFRGAQHQMLFTLDADCIPSTHQTDWQKNRQLLRLVAASGTALFVSVDPQTRSDAIDTDLRDAITLALDGGKPGGVEPLDWLDTPTPQRWRYEGTEQTFDWLADSGANPF